MSIINNSNSEINAKLKSLLNNKLNKKYQQQLSEKYSKLEDLSKEYIINMAAEQNTNQVGLPLSKEIEEFIERIKDLFDEGFFDSDLNIEGTLVVDRIECGEIAVTTSNNLNITKVIESVFGDAAAEDPNLDIFSLIGGRDLKLKKQTISESHLINCHIVSA